MKTMCMEWHDLTLREFKEAHDSCKDDGTFGTTPCPKPGVLGTCRHKEEKITTYLYKSEIFGTVKEAKEFCDDGEFAAATK